MNILMIAPEPFLVPRGTPISVYQRLKGLSALGHQVDLVTYHLGEPSNIPGVRIIRIPGVGFIKSIKPGPSFKKVLLDLLLFAKTIQVLLAKRYDVIHSHEEAAYFANLLSKIYRIPHLYDMHSSLPKQIMNSRQGKIPMLVRIFDWLERWVLRTCDAVITIGSDLQQRVNEINPAANQVNIENLPIQTVLPQAASPIPKELTIKGELNGRQVILYTGTFEHYQGLDLLLQSFRLVIRERPASVLVLVGGQATQIGHWKRVVREHGLEGNVLFTGTVPMERMVAYLELADILVSPRLKGTTIPLKLYTYLFSGKPIIATLNNAHSQVLKDEFALLVPPTAEGFAQGIMRLLDNPSLGRQLGDRARQVAEECYSFGAYTRRLDRIYQTLTQPGKVEQEVSTTE